MPSISAAGDEPGLPKESSLITLIGISIAFHLVVFGIIPLATSLLYHSEIYKRPPTFSLVAMQPSQARAMVAAHRTAEHKIGKAGPVAKNATTPAPKKQHGKIVKEHEKAAQEDDQDLSELLSAIPATNVSTVASSQDFKYNWYLQDVISRVEQNWKPPAGLTQKDNAAVVVSFTIYQGGDISAVGLAQSSGIPTLDDLAYQAIRSAAPFGQLPIGFSGRKLDITYTLNYVKQ